jgi:hypothetical protein
MLQNAFWNALSRLPEITAIITEGSFGHFKKKARGASPCLR